ncbi:hypothetical protein [Gracilimonas sediminicola]|uniref:hypothetical protein n=1 Tax=Gracilimonas sediminicola TaxID=2952158 RepID=UPI0038D39FDD
MKKSINHHINNLPAIAVLIALIGFSGLSSPKAQAQQVDFGADMVNRYVWRGLDFGNAASIQPGIEFSQGGFTVGTWASYAMSPVSAGASELDLYASYNFGAVSIGLTDYYFPNAGVGFFDFSDDGGAHILEPSLSFNGTENIPITLYAAINAYNDPDNSIYIEAGVPFSVQETDLQLFAGFVPAESAYYATTKAAVTNIGLSVQKELTITENFSLPLFSSYILNPYSETSFLVFGFSL